MDRTHTHTANRGAGNVYLFILGGLIALGIALMFIIGTGTTRQNGEGVIGEDGSTAQQVTLDRRPVGADPQAGTTGTINDTQPGATIDGN